MNFFFPPPTYGNPPMQITEGAQDPFWATMLRNLGLDDPRIRGAIGSQFLTAPNLHTALASLGQVPMMRDQMRQAEDERRLEEERRRREEEDRQQMRKLREAELARKKRLDEQADRERQQLEEERARLAEADERHRALVDANEPEGLRAMFYDWDPDKYRQRVATEKDPTAAEKNAAELAGLRLQEARERIENYRSLVESRVEGDEGPDISKLGANDARVLSGIYREIGVLEGLGYQRTPEQTERLGELMRRAQEVTNRMEERTLAVESPFGTKMRSPEEAALAEQMTWLDPAGKKEAIDALKKKAPNGLTGIEWITALINQGKSFREAFRIVLGSM